MIDLPDLSIWIRFWTFLPNISISFGCYNLYKRRISAPFTFGFFLKASVINYRCSFVISFYLC